MLRLRPALALIFLLVAGWPATGWADSLDARLQAGGEPGPMVAVGAHLYLALGPAIEVSSFDLAAPHTLGITPPLPGLVRGLAATGGYLYAAVRTSYPDGLLAIYSLADPARPTLVRLLNYHPSAFSSPGALLAAGSRLYLADSELGLFTIELADPENPVLNLLASSLPALEMAISGGRLVAWGPNAFDEMTVQVFSLANPAAPSPLGGFSTEIAFGGAVDGNFFYTIGFGLTVHDFSNLSQPQVVFQDGNLSSRDALVASGRLYFGNDSGLHVWNVSNLAQATEIAVLPAPLDRSSQSALLNLGGNPKLVFATQTGRALRFAAGDSPTLEHSWDLPGGVATTDLAEHGGHLFTADFYSGLHCLAQASLASCGRLDVPANSFAAVEGLAVAGQRAYLANWGYGLLIDDISQPAAPSLLGSIAIPYATAVEVVGTIAYVVTSTAGGTLVAVDVANPASPQILSTALTTKSLDLLHHNGLLLVADESLGGPGGLRIFSLAQPANPVQLAHYTACDSAHAVAAAGQRAYLACTDGSLHIVDLANPAMPVQLGTYLDPELLGSGLAVAVRGSRAVFGREDVVDLLEVGNPAAIVRLARAQLGAAVRRLEFAAGGQVAVAAGQAGVYQLELGLFHDGFESGSLAAWSAHLP